MRFEKQRNKLGNAHVVIEALMADAIKVGIEKFSPGKNNTDWNTPSSSR